MRINLKYNIVGLALLILFSIGCDKDQIVEAPISPDGYPMVTYTVDNDVDQIREGEALTYTVKMDKALDRAVTFSVKYLGGTADENDFSYTAGTIAPYTTETQVVISFTNDVTIEEAETLKFEIGAYGIGDGYLINPASKNLVKEITVNPSVNLDVVFAWNSSDDIDYVVFKDNGGIGESYGDAGATSSNPEIGNSISLNDPGTYYISLMNWGAPNFDYTFTFGKPDATTETITGTFTSDNLNAYYLDLWTGWGDAYSAYRVLKVVNDGSAISITKLDAFTASDYSDVTGLDGIWSGTDGALPDFGYTTSSVEVTLDAGEAYIDSLGLGWMTDFWGESIVSSDPVKMIMYADGRVVIPHQDYWTTLYDGAEYPYTIYGVGTYDGTNLHLEYELNQEGFLCANWTFGNGYNNYNFFQADLTHAKAKVENVKKDKAGFVKPDVNLNRPVNRFKK